MKKWVVAAKRADFKAIGEKYHIDQVTARLIRNRDVIGDDALREYLYGTIADMHDPEEMKGIVEAADLLLFKMKEKAAIRIIGDYDIDGVTSTYILYTGLKKCGAIVDYEIPDRIRDGYGINEQFVQNAWEDGIDTILTCDNGISAIDQIAYAKKLGMTVIVTDHHELRTREEDGKVQVILPDADVVVNPHQPDCPYPYKDLCGGAVAYKLMQELYRKKSFPDREIENLIEYAAIATVGDVMKLTGENRIIVKEGLKRLNHTQNIGLKALIRVNGLEDKEINSYHIGFVIGPCINASGRLTTAKKALELLLSTSQEKAEVLAEELLSLNAERKELTRQGYEEAVEQIESTSLKKDKVLIVYLPDCHESIAGIIAGRIRERYYRPVFVLTNGEKSVKGSGRSIEGYSMFEEMQKCDDLFLNYGGHPMAAGLSLEKENIQRLRERLNANACLTEDDLMEKICIDVPMPISYITEHLIEELNVLEPFGTANKKPVFAEKNVSILGARILGQNRNVVKMQVSDNSGAVMDALYFGDIEVFRSYLEEKFGYTETEKMFQNRKSNIILSIIYYPTVNEFRGQRSIQIVISDYQ
mgnify:FL=1